MAELNQPGFSRDTRPNLFHNPPFGTEYGIANTVSLAPAKDVYPARDNRYPAYAAPLADGRLVTDYRPNALKTSHRPINSLPRSG